MTGGIHIAPGANVTINGIDVQCVVDMAADLAAGRPPHGFALVARTREGWIAHVAARLLTKMRSKGYSRDICRNALWAKVVDEANRCSEVAQLGERVAVNHQGGGSSPSLGANAVDETTERTITESLSSGAELPTANKA